MWDLIWGEVLCHRIWKHKKSQYEYRLSAFAQYNKNGLNNMKQYCFFPY